MEALTRGFSHFVTSMTAPVASGWSNCRVGFTPTGKRRLSTAHTHCRRGTNWSFGSCRFIQYSEIRLLRSRDGRVLSGIVFMPVFSADIFRPFTQGASISYRRRPGHREGALILDREF